MANKHSHTLVLGCSMSDVRSALAVRWATSPSSLYVSDLSNGAKSSWCPEQEMRVDISGNNDFNCFPEAKEWSVLRIRNTVDDVDQQQTTYTVEEPVDLIRLSLRERIDVKMRNDRELRGRLHADNQHLNMILGDVEETVTTIEIGEETYEEIHKSKKRNISMLFVRGDSFVLVAPLLRIG
ncbi:U6 snRNA-associated Sm-like protein LSm3 [Echinops telfairi]|uniref:U6 snRNA-associated Sm-like protein LSm3 n=1 Tax=Echinops telfairi TaxID=9371 RepID=A0AC55CJD7_ECHTE|nr:U6 snRNA-associated Sm-like protein LSm3 [Echinops telfairi]